MGRNISSRRLARIARRFIFSHAEMAETAEILFDDAGFLLGLKK